MDRARSVYGTGPASSTGVADHVHDAAERAVADRHGDRLVGVLHRLAAHQAFGGVHRDRAHRRFAEVLGDFEHQPVALVLGLQRVQNGRQMAVELHVDDGADDLDDASDLAVSHVSLRNAQMTVSVTGIFPRVALE